jgi:hypothetical protein
MGKLHAIKTFYDARLGLVTLEDDVLSIVRQVRQLYGDRVYVLLDETNGFYHFVEKTDTEEKLIFTTDVLDARALERLQQADSQWRGYADPYDEAEREQDLLRADQERSLRERIREPLERFVHTMRQDGIEPSLPTPVPVSGRRRKVGRPSA